LNYRPIITVPFFEGVSLEAEPLTGCCNVSVQSERRDGIFWLLLVGSCVAAASAWRTNPGQRTLGHVGSWLLRLLMGSMWWQQSLWKIPPNYDGLIYWMKQLAQPAAIPLEGQLVQDFVLPNITLFGPLVYAIEVSIGVSLMLGLLTRVGAGLGVLMALNLLLGLYSAPGEWPWAYGFLVIIQSILVLEPPERSLGIDAVLSQRGRLPALFG
jgi:uncharacterized membrane protein YphA (DoxX/SURF4 family)